MREGLWLKRVLLGGIVLVGTSQVAFANISVEGHYQGKNLIVQSPESEDGFGYCVNRVTVNGQVSSTSYQTSAFQIDMTEFDINYGDPVLVVLEHEEGCKPKLLNPEVLLPASTFILSDISCTSDGVLTWTTTGESGKLPYQIEQYKWNKWVVIGEVDGNGASGTNKYIFNVSPHSGENKIRVSQTDNSGKKRISKEVTFTCPTCPEPKLTKSEEGIEFQSNGKPVKTKYEIYDAYGNIIKKGMSTEVICAKLKEGIYHVNYDNKYEKYIKN